MKIKIAETGKIEELIAQNWTDTQNWTEWTTDLLGGYDNLPRQNDDGTYTLAQEEYAWWDPVVDKLNAISFATHTGKWYDFVMMHTDNNTGHIDCYLDNWYHLTDGDDLDTATDKQMDWLIDNGIVQYPTSY